MFDTILNNSSEEQKKLVPANPDRARPKALWVAEGIGQEAREVPVEQMQVQLDFTFSESLWAPECFLQNSQEQRDRVTAHVQGDCQYDALQLVNMGPLGYGLFARKPIKKGSFLFFYTGEYASGTYFQNRDGAYAVGINDDLFGYEPFDFLSSSFGDRRKSGVVDAAKIGNFSRFAQHLPRSGSLQISPDRAGTDFVILNESVLQSIATCNQLKTETDESCVRDKAQYGGFPVTLDGLSIAYIQADTDYQPGDIIGISYGRIYWLRKKIQPELFTRKGHLLPYDQYYPCELYLEVPGERRRWDTQEVFRALILKQGIKDVSYESLRTKTLEHLGDARYQGHMSCFMRKNPKVVLDYRSQRFFEKNKQHEAGHWRHATFTGPSQYAGNQPAPKTFWKRLDHFGFMIDSTTRVYLDNTDYKIPKPAKF